MRGYDNLTSYLITRGCLRRYMHDFDEIKESGVNSRRCQRKENMWRFYDKIINLLDNAFHREHNALWILQWFQVNDSADITSHGTKPIPKRLTKRLR